MHPTVRRLLIVCAILAVVFTAGTILRNQLGIAFEAEAVRDYVLGLGPAAPILFVFIVAGRALLGLPSQLVLIAAGLCFGTGVGALVGGAGLMLSGTAVFAAARYAGRDVIEQRLGDGVQKILNFTSRRTGIVAFSLAFGYPISPLTPLHAAAGWTPMPFANFMTAAFFGGVIRAAVFAYFGNALVEASWTALLAPLAVMALILAIPLAFAEGRAWLRDVFVGRGDDSAAQATSDEAGD
ncbi:MAG: VTT domain-containing protein [Myxococcota bacterium]